MCNITYSLLRYKPVYCMWTQMLQSTVCSQSSYLKLLLLNLFSSWECSTSRESDAEDSLSPLPASWCIHNQNMLFWDPHGRFLLAYILNNQLLAGLPAATSVPQRHAQGTLGAPAGGGRWCCRLTGASVYQEICGDARGTEWRQCQGDTLDGDVIE